MHQHSVIIHHILGIVICVFTYIILFNSNIYYSNFIFEKENCLVMVMPILNSRLFLLLYISLFIKYLLTFLLMQTFLVQVLEI